MKIKRCLWIALAAALLLLFAAAGGVKTQEDGAAGQISPPEADTGRRQNQFDQAEPPTDEAENEAPENGETSEEKPPDEEQSEKSSDEEQSAGDAQEDQAVTGEQLNIWRFLLDGKRLFMLKKQKARAEVLYLPRRCTIVPIRQYIHQETA